MQRLLEGMLLLSTRAPLRSLLPCNRSHRQRLSQLLPLLLPLRRLPRLLPRLHLRPRLPVLFLRPRFLRRPPLQQLRKALVLPS